MSRSALWRQEANIKDRQRLAEEKFRVVIEEGRACHVKGLIPLVGPDDTFNVHPTLLQTVAQSPYFQRCCDKLTDWNALIDEIYYEVKHMEPWTIGASKSPSTAFCLLIRLFTLRCTERQMTLMLHHLDSPYIRCLGFLYLRYAADPSTLWSWVEPYLYDPEPVQICQGKADTTVGEYVRFLLENLEYYGTRLPRLPLAVERHIKVKLLQAERVEERAKLHEENKAAMEYFQTVASRVQVLYGDEENPVMWYDAVVDRVILRDRDSGELLNRPKFQVTFPEYGNTEIVTLGEMDLPGTHAVGHTEEDTRKTRDESSGRSERERQRGYDEYDRGYSSERQRYSDYRTRRDDRDYRRSDLSEDYRQRPDDYQRNGTPRYDRSRSRERGDCRTSDSAGDGKSSEEQELMREVLRREREKSAAKGRAYASRPAGFRGVNTDDSGSSRHSIQDKWAPPMRNTEKESLDENKLVSAPVQKKTAAELAAIEEKKRKLLAKYG